MTMKAHLIVLLTLASGAAIVNCACVQASEEQVRHGGVTIILNTTSDDYQVYTYPRGALTQYHEESANGVYRMSGFPYGRGYIFYVSGTKEELPFGERLAWTNVVISTNTIRLALSVPTQTVEIALSAKLARTMGMSVRQGDVSAFLEWYKDGVELDPFLVFFVQMEAIDEDWRGVFRNASAGRYRLSLLASERGVKKWLGQVDLEIGPDGKGILRAKIVGDVAPVTGTHAWDRMREDVEEDIENRSSGAHAEDGEGE